MKFSKIAMALLVSSVIFTGCGSDSDGNGDEKKSSTTTPTTPTPTHNAQVEGSSSGTSKYLKFDEEFLSERESAGDRYYMVGCEDNAYDLNGKDIDIARYDIKTSNMVGSGESLGLKVSIKNGKLFIGELYNFKIIGDYGDYVVVQTGFGDFSEQTGNYKYWFPKPLVNNDVTKIFQRAGDNYMHDLGEREFIHEGHCTPNSLNEHIADWKSKQ